MRNLRLGLIPIALFAMVFMVACGNDDDPATPSGSDPIASFQFEVDATNFLQVTFTNFSQNATTYSWDFGDGNSSTDKDPVHTYANGGQYTVVLTASNAAGTEAKRSETITVTSPDEALTLLAGTSSKSWYLLREGIALGIGPAPGNVQWWSFGGVTPLGDRPCILDDEYVFHTDGTFENKTAGTIFVDSEGNGGWKPSEGCFDESSENLTGTGGEDLSDFANGGNYTYDLKVDAGQLTITGSGAYIGLPNKTTNGDSFIPEGSKNYSLINFTDGAAADTMTLALVQGDGSAWTFYLVSYDGDNTASLPELPSSNPTASFSFESTGLQVTFTNNSRNATSYTWDFGDGNSSTDMSPTHTYAANGTYTVKLTASDGTNSDEATVSITVPSANPIPTTMGHTFESVDGADKLSLFSGNSTIDFGVADPAGGTTNVGRFNRTVGEPFQEAIMTFDPPTDINFSALTTVSLEVYLPSSNDHTGPLTRTVIVGLADQAVAPSGNWWEDHAQYETTLDASQENQWVKLEYQLATPNTGANTSDPDSRSDLDMVFINIGSGGHQVGGTFFIRNLEFK